MSPAPLRENGFYRKGCGVFTRQRALERKGPCLYVCTDGSAHACGVGDCPCLVPTLGDLGETSGPRIDRIPPTRPPWWRRQFRELKKLIFLAPSKCRIDLLGPVANRTVFKRVSPKPSVSIQVAVKAEQLSQRILHRIDETRCKSNNQQAFE